MAPKTTTQTDTRGREGEFRTLAENAPDIIFRLDSELRFLYVNAQVKSIGEREPGEFIGKTVHQVGYPPEFAAWWEAQCRAVLTSGKPAEVAFDFDAATGKRRLEARLVPEFGADGRVESVLGITRDVTERQGAEEAARRLAAIVESSDDAIIGKTLEGVITDWNAGAERMYGYTAAEAIGRPVAMLAPPDHEDELPVILERIRRGETVPRLETVRVRKDGQRLEVWLTISPVKDRAGRIVGASTITRDITENKRATEALRESEARFRAVLESGLDAPYRRDLRTDRYDYISPVIEALTGFTAEEFAAMPVAEVLARVHPEDRPAVLARLQEEGNDRLLLEYRFQRKDGRYVWLADNATVARDEKGRPQYRTGVVRDVTGRKAAEEERERLLAAAGKARAAAEQANQAKDQFLALVSHELRNPLSAIAAGVSLLRTSCPVEGRAARALEIVERNADLQTRLINDLLDLSRLQRGKLSLQQAPTRLERVVESAAQAQEAEARNAGLTLSVTVEPELWVQGDPDRLQQVVTNLLTNAIKFTPSGGQVSVSAGRSEGRARVIVADTGIGIDRELMGSLFVPFHQGELASQSKPGLGLGLALVKGLVEQHGGGVWAESEGAGKGSRFLVELPLIEGSGFRVRGSRVAPASESRSPFRDRLRRAQPRALDPIRVLLVEDNEDTLALMQADLEAHGYEVHAAASGDAALEALRQGKPEIILSDIRMPGIDGYEFLRRARALPGMAEVPAFAVTAYGQEEDVRKALEAGFIGHFTKPVNLAALDRRIQELFGVVQSGREGA